MAGICRVFTDSMLLGEVVRRAAEPLGDRVVWTPLLWLGNSHHHLDFAGTLSAAPRTYLDVLGDLIDNLVTHGFRRIVLLNGHGGNIVPAPAGHFRGPPALPPSRRPAAFWRRPTGFWAASPSWSIPRSCRQQMGHACEWETSMILHLAPHLVGDLSAIEPVSPAMPFEPATQGWITKERSEPGHIGDPRLRNGREGRNTLSHFLP